MEILETGVCTCVWLIDFSQRWQQNEVKEGRPFYQIMFEQLDVHMGKMKWVIDLNENAKNYRTSRRKQKNLCDHGKEF